MRIITGRAKGALLETLPGLETRPTAERVKEAIFSMIQFDIEGRRVLDLFAGSGQLGLEALSRGAAHATFIDSSREAVDVILKNAAKARLRESARVSSMDFSAFLKSASDEYDIIFLDPPYNTSMMSDALRLIAERGLLRDGGFIVCETDTGEEERRRRKKERRDGEDDVQRDVFGGDAELADKYTVERTSRYGRTRITILSI